MLRRTLFPCLLVLALALAAGTAGAQPVAHIAKTCSLSAKEKGGSKPSTLGATYVTHLAVSHTSCGKGKGVVKAWNSCRKRHGKKGRCTSKVKGYSCKEKRQSISTEFDSSVSCKSGAKRVSFKLEQFT